MAKEHTIQELWDLFLQTNDRNKLINKAAQVLKNPLLLCDTSYHFICRSDPRSIRDKSWRAGTQRGNWSYELVSTINSLDLDYSGARHTRQILSNINPMSSSRRMVGTLCMDGVHLGYFLILEENAPFDSVSEDTYRQVETILAKCVCTEPSALLPGKSGSSESIMLDLLQSGFDSRKLFAERAAGSELARLSTYRVFCITARDGGSTPADLRSAIGQCLPLSWQVRFQDQVVVLADFGSRLYQEEDPLSRFQLFLQQHSLCAGQSDSFADPYELKRYYQQAQSAADFGLAFQDERSILPYDDYKLHSLFSQAEERELFSQYATQIIRKIHEYDQKNATDYLETVYQYLSCSCSVHKAAEKLYVHRNTVAYRIARVKELFDLSFDDGYQNYMNFTSCLLWKFCQKQAGSTNE